MKKRFTIPLCKRPALLIFICCLALASLSLPAVAQSRVINGTVKSQEDNESVAGANVLAKGTAIGTITDVEGHYSLTVPQETGTLVFSFIGLLTQELEIGDLSTIDISLPVDSKQLAEVVVTALGFERDKKSLGFATQAVSGDVLQKAPSASIVNSLSGRVVGMQVISSSVPGGSPEFVLRGFSSVGSNNQPLIVVDGVPMAQTVNTTATDRSNNQRYGGGISELDPNSIAELSVLKGPSAAALYGSRAANGVILIKTKTGAGTNGIGVELNYSTSFERPLVKPKFQNTYGGGSGGVTWYADGRSGTVDGVKGTAGTDESWGSPMDGRPVRQWWSGTDEVPLRPEPNNWEQRWETGSTTTMNVALTGAGDKGSFRLSVGELKQDGIVYNNNYWRKNFRLNSSHQFNDKLSVTVVAEYIKSGSDNRSFLSDQSFIWHHRQTNFDKLKNYRDYEDVHIQRDGDTDPPNWQHTFFTNPYFLEEVVVRPNEKDRLLGNISLNYEITPSLSLLLRSGTDLWTDTRISVTQFERIRTGNLTRGSYNEEIVRNQETNSDAILSFTKSLPHNFTILAQGGAASRKFYGKRNYTNVQQLIVDRLYSTSNYAIPNIDESSISRIEVNSLFASGQFGFNDFLFLDITGRNDWGSTLPAANRSFFYPSVALSAVITEMVNLDNTILSFAKLRANWAKVGNAGNDPYLNQQVYALSGLYDGSIPKVSESKRIANVNLKPESTAGIELGAEMKFLKGRIGLDFTYYSQSTKDQILAVDISKASGYKSLVLNAGEITNEGIEAMLNGTVIKASNGFTWDLGLNFSRNRNKVVDLGEDLVSYTLWTNRGASLEARVGQPYGSLYGIKFDRAPDGSILFKNGLPVTLPGQHVIGNITPDWTGGISNSFHYKGFNLSALVDIKAGGDIYDMGSSLARVTGVLEESEMGREEGTIGQGVKNIGSDEAPTYVPNDVVVPTKQFMGYYNGRAYHEAAVFDGSYVKLREVTLTYSLPTKLFANIFLKSATVGITGRNVAMLFKNTRHIDPEVSSSDLGYNYGQLPGTRSLGFNVNVKF